MAAGNKPSESERKTAIKEYHDAASKAEKAVVMKKYPFLVHIFSEGNHS